MRGDDLVVYTFPERFGLDARRTERSMDTDNLVHMANRIGDFFEGHARPRRGARRDRQHLRKFWEPRMRRALLEHVDAAGGDGLLDIVRDAVREHRDALTPTLPA